MKKLGIFILIFPVVVFVLQFFFKSLRYDFINGGGGLSFSASKKESIERGVYIGDLKFVSLHTSGGPIDFEVNEAWVEKAWRSGAWYWTTKPEKYGCKIILHTSLTEDKEDRLHFKTDRMDRYEGIGCVSGHCSGDIGKLPASDTLKYNLLRENKYIFPNSDSIIGEMVLVVKRY